MLMHIFVLYILAQLGSVFDEGILIILSIFVDLFISLLERYNIYLSDEKK